MRLVHAGRLSVSPLVLPRLNARLRGRWVFVIAAPDEEHKNQDPYNRPLYHPHTTSTTED